MSEERAVRRMICEAATFNEVSEDARAPGETEGGDGF